MDAHVEAIIDEFASMDRIYRGGSLDKQILPWTSQSQGANTGVGHIRVDHISTIQEQLDKGYRILGGINGMMGAPGEGEITFIKLIK